MATSNQTSSSRRAEGAIVLRKIGFDDVYAALRQGFADFVDRPSHYAFVILIYPIMGVVIGLWTSGNQALPLLYPLIAGFALVGPIAALGLYEISRRRERGLEASWRHAFDVFQSPQIFSIAVLALLLLAIFFIWLSSAQALYNWTHLAEVQESLGSFAQSVFTTREGWTLLIVGNLVGVLFAAIVLSISIVSFPLLLDRPVGVGAAIAASLRATFLNPMPILLWGAIVGALLFAGSLPLFIGLAVVLPVLGHATWHLYRKLVA